MKDYEVRAKDFLKIANQFRLGDLVTESSHPMSTNLSSLAKNDLAKAIKSLVAIDLAALQNLKKYLPLLTPLSLEIKKTLREGGKIFLCGCGATGRLSLSLETIWREDHPLKDVAESVIGFMAGGDLALIHSIENFEDHPEYGERQLLELGFTENDLMIGITEGGETPFVIGATLKAAELSKRSPYFLYCNPDDLLKKVAKRSKEVLENSKVKKINLTVGPMAIAGSTRMQATTVQMFSVGLALLGSEKGESFIAQEFDRLFKFYETLDHLFLEVFIEIESQLYQKSGYLFYGVRDFVGMTVLTDTTERAPTFSLFPFENKEEMIEGSSSLCYLTLAEAHDSANAWKKILKRSPRTLEWSELNGIASYKRLLGFDMSTEGEADRIERISSAHGYFVIEGDEQKLNMSMNGREWVIDWRELSTLSQQIILKMLLNTHSTLVMGRLGRYEGNLMTYVRPSNNKLIDRAVRFASELLTREGIHASYEDLVVEVFRLMETVSRNEPLVLRLVESIKNKKLKES